MRPSGGGHDAVLYQRPRSSKETDEFYRNRVVGGLWIGRRLSPAETSLQLGIDVADIDDLESMLTGLDASATRVLRGLEPGVDHAVRVAETSDGRDRGRGT